MAKKKEKRTFNVSTFMFVKEFWSVGWTKRDAWNIFRSCDGFLHHFMTFNRQTINQSVIKMIFVVFFTRQRGGSRVLCVLRRSLKPATATSSADTCRTSTGKSTWSLKVGNVKPRHTPLLWSGSQALIQFILKELDGFSSGFCADQSSCSAPNRENQFFMERL